MAEIGQAGEIYVLGLGPGDPLDLPVVNLALMRGRKVYLRTSRHPVVSFLEADGISLVPLDHFYDEEASFDTVYRKMTDFLLSEAVNSHDPVIFAVPGHPLVGETVGRQLLNLGPDRGVRVRLWPAPSFLEAIYLLLGIDPAQGLLVLDSFQLASPAAAGLAVPPGIGVLVAQLYDRAIASEVKLTLMEYFPDEHLVTVVSSAGIRGMERVRQLPLYQLDRIELDHLTSVYLPPLAEQQPEAVNVIPAALKQNDESGWDYPLDSLIEVMGRLLGPGGCPWDQQQTHQTLKQYLIEEAYEVIDAIDDGDMHKLCEELGDLLLQIVFHTSLAAERGDFTMDQVVSGIVEKLHRRHPHVFGTTIVKDASEVLVNWEAIKQQEGDGESDHWKSLLAGVPRYLPSLQRAQKVQGKAALVGFDWPDAKGAADKFAEEWNEVKEALVSGDQESLKEEFGDLFFATVNVARLLQVNAEEALCLAVDKFIRRFNAMELKSRKRGQILNDLSLMELDRIWEEIKREESLAGTLKD